MLRSSVVALGLVLAGCVPMAAPDVPVSTANLVSSSGAVLGTVRVFSEPTGVMLRIDAAGVPAGTAWRARSFDRALRSAGLHQRRAALEPDDAKAWASQP